MFVVTKKLFQVVLDVPERKDLGYARGPVRTDGNRRRIAEELVRNVKRHIDVENVKLEVIDLEWCTLCDSCFQQDCDGEPLCCKAASRAWWRCE